MGRPNHANSRFGVIEIVDIDSSSLKKTVALPKVRMTLSVVLVNNEDYNSSQNKTRHFPFFKVDDVSLTQELRNKLVLSSEKFGKTR